MPAVVLVSLSPAWVSAQAPPLEPIESVEIGQHREFRVNGEPFLPLMLWLHSEVRIEDGLSIGVNTFAGNGGELSPDAYMQQLSDAGLYGVLHLHRDIAGHDHLLAWIHRDEPDMPERVSEARITPGPDLKPNPSTPLHRLVDGKPFNWAVLDPLEGAEVTIKLQEPATIEAVALRLTISERLARAKEVTFLSDGQPLLRAELENRKGEQRFELDNPTRIEQLTLRVESVYPGDRVWGSISEVLAYTSEDENVLLAPTVDQARTPVEEVAEVYQRARAMEPVRPMLVTFTTHFASWSNRYDTAYQQEIYPRYVRHADVIGYDLYPIFGYNKPEWLDRVGRGVTQLRELAGDKPVYAWIETSKGSRWIDYDEQLDVEPRHTRAETWMALIRGATAIGYFTHRWHPSYEQFGISEPMRAELAELNARLTRLAPALLAAPAEREIAMELQADDESIPQHFKVTRHEGHVYLFAQNIDMDERAGQARFRVEGLEAGTEIEVLDEERTIRADSEAFGDAFDPLQVHVYRWPQ
ncbi:MAG: hypothetical protein ACODAQ_00045 [Phycisphaeraceae bacterium]